MQQYLTLEEAADRLNMSPDQLREMAKSKRIRAFQDRGSWRFRSQDVEEEARKRGIGSDPELQLKRDSSGRMPKPAKPKPPSDADDMLSLDLDLDDKQSGSKSGRSGRSPRPKAASDSDVRLVMDSNLDFQVDPDSNVRLEKSPKPVRKSKMRPADSGVRLTSDRPSDSDVKMVPSGGTDSDVKPRPAKSPSDSDIRLQESQKGNPRNEANIITEEIIDLDAEEERLAKKASGVSRLKRSPGSSGSHPALPTDSPFEISEPDLDLDKKKGKKPAKKADRDSSSDYEVIPFDSSKSPDLGSGDIPLLAGDEDVDLGGPVKGSLASGNSGLNLQDPADSGISLEPDGQMSDDSVEFELTLDSGVTPKPSSESMPVAEDSSSEFELSLDDDSGSDSSSSEFELSLDDSGDVVGLSDDSGSDSEFELTLDDSGGLAVAGGGDDDDAGEIFEETNFDVPALDESDSQNVDIDESATDLDGSDFELTLDDESSSESGSQVVALDDDEDTDDAAATIAKPRTSGKKPKKVADVDDDDAGELDLDLDAEVEEEPVPKKAKAKGKGKKAVAVVEDDESEDEVATTMLAPEPAEWGALPLVMLLPTVLVLFLVGFMGYELVRGTNGYTRASGPAKLVVDPIARPIAEALEAKLPE